MSRVYLAGPITGLSYGGSTNWRAAVAEALEPFGIEGLSPMRGKGYLLQEKVVGDEYSDRVLSTAKGITTRDRWDVERSDLVLMNLLGATKVSIGTMIEAGWADACRVPIVLVIDEGNVHTHAMLREVSGFVVGSLDEAVDVVKALLL